MQSWLLYLYADEFKREPPRDYWPAAVTSGADGAFRIDNVVPRTAMAELVVIAEGYAPTLVRVAHADSKLADSTDNYRKPEFTLVLQAPYLVEGRYTDETTGEPIAGVRTNVRYSKDDVVATGLALAEATSDAAGRYELRIPPADRYNLAVDPPLGYPAIRQPIRPSDIEQLAGPDRTFAYPLKLRRGVVLRGKVIDEQTGRGVAGADVVYAPSAAAPTSRSCRSSRPTTAASS